MSFVDRFQPLALSAFMALTATSCPPDRIFSFANGEGDDGPLACPVRGLPVSIDGPQGLDSVMAGLAERGVGSEMFDQENFDRLKPLAAVCSASQIDRFAEVQNAVSDRISQVPPAEIAATLEDLYAQAYVYDDAHRTMAAGDSPAQQEAKRRLDLWIAAVDQRAFSDQTFWQRVWDEPRIRTVMAMNSPHLTPEDRGDLHQLFQAESQGDEAIRTYLREHAAEGHVRLLDWLDSYDGRSENFFEHPYWRSITEYGVAIESHFGRERILRLGQESSPHEDVARLMEERGYGDAYRRFMKLGSEALIDHYRELMNALTPQSRPASRWRIVADLMIMGIVFGERGMDPTQEIQRRGVESFVKYGVSRQDAELMYRLQTGIIQYTHDRLDDYHARHGLLGEYRALYRDIISHPLEEVFSSSNRARYGTWGNFFLNRSIMKIPIFLDDLDRARRDVMDENGGALQFGRLGFEFATRDTTQAQWFTPSDLGLCHSLTGGPLTVAGLAHYNGRSADELICNNVELVAFLPNNLQPDHALATAIGVFGVITLRNSDSTLLNGKTASIPWTRGSLLEVVTHEASHVDWFRQNFDHDSQRLPMLALNERRAYRMGGGYLTDYIFSGLALDGEAAHANERLLFVSSVVDAANRTIGVSPDQPARMDPDYWEVSWDYAQAGRFAFQPPSVLQGEEQRRMLERAFGTPSDQEVSAAWSSGLLAAMREIHLTREEQDEVWWAMHALEIPENGASGGIYFLASHPLTRTINAMAGRLGLLPYQAIDVSASDWFSLKSMFGRRVIDRDHYSSLSRPRRRAK